ncbi:MULTISPECIES: oligoribonuclease [Helcobacillus]|uniref:Oligoribonuclease n=1 Tax=Helcobacillus massiliensis TaxID=521392 RepID=A0A839QQM1_9MICO|nr:mannose/cellobiose epimerase-like protein (N-acyl-D-glucosamine 2-epimerase family)/oligoribonuclease (3'-5' exoribonuclease) [Helcobacillus massiliensis]
MKSTKNTVSNRIVWVDCEMTGLDKAEDALIEVAVLVTDADLTVLGDGVDIVIRPPEGAIESMNDFVRQMHTDSGLLEELADGVTLEEAQQQCLEYVRQYVPEPGKAPLAGNSVGTDRAFLERDLPLFESYLSYRTIDVSSLKELAKRWLPRVFFNTPQKHGGHRALADIRESIQELKYYREAMFVSAPGPTTDYLKVQAKRFELPADGSADSSGAADAADAEGDHPASVTWLDSPTHARWLASEGDALLEFAAGSALDEGGFGWLDETGEIDESKNRELWINCRMTHVFSLASMLGNPEAGQFADHGVRALRDVFSDAEHGGWFDEVALDGSVAGDSKSAYAHAFVVLAAASATAAGRPGARALLDDALEVLLERFYDRTEGMVRESFTRDFSSTEEYRGINANMHTVEALLAAADVLDRLDLLQIAVGIIKRAVNEFARDNDWLLPEHYSSEWEMLPEFNTDNRADPFRPYGATIGHWFEWARLTLTARAGLAQQGQDQPQWMLECALALMNRAAEFDGIDGTGGFPYTVDWQGEPVARERMHWVAAEAVGAAAVAYRTTRDRRWADLYQQWWEHIAEDFIDPAGGSWHHELDIDLEPSTTVWRGKPDAYHAVQATLIPRLPVWPSLAEGVRRGLLDNPQ